MLLIGRLKKDHSGEVINGIKLEYRIKDYIPPGAKNSLAQYHCSCVACSKEFDSLYSGIKRRKYPGCGCAYLESKHDPRPNKTRDISGKRFYYCIAVKRLENGKWLCLCDCGKYFEASLSHLTSGHTKSCGCYRSENTKTMKMLNLENKYYNNLYVVKYLYSKKHPNEKTSSMWLCICSCGSYTIAAGSDIVSGVTKSCGCLKASKRELEIRRILKLNNVYFITEYKFDDLFLKQSLRFDFAIMNDNNELLALIEHYGEQHYEKLSKSTNFGKQQREVTDILKQEYCKNKNIKLFIIKYNDDLEKTIKGILAELHVNTVPSEQEIV